MLAFALHWQPQHSLAWPHWMYSFLDIVNMELSEARMHGATQKTLWSRVISKLKGLL